MYLISTLQGGVTLFKNSSKTDDNQLRMAFLFGYIIVGNVVDNIAAPKKLAIFLQVTLGVTWCSTGTIVKFSL